MNTPRKGKTEHSRECPHCNEYSRFKGEICPRCREWLRKAAELLKL